MKALLLGFGEEQNAYARCLQQQGYTAATRMAPEDEVKVVLLRNVQCLAEVKPHVQALRHVFICRQSLPTGDLQTLHKLANEAGVAVQFSAPALYEWRLPEVLQRLGEVQLMQVYKDNAGGSLQNELLLAARSAGARLGKVKQERAIAPPAFNVQGFRVDFTNSTSAHFWTSGKAAAARHEVRIFGSNGMATIDMLKREVAMAMLDNTSVALPFLPADKTIENELSDFIDNIRKSSPTLISAIEVETLRIVEELLNQ